ncbi:hypothetical protein [Bacteroides acidifaciens]|uniref:hypothetical protein n=1 Tax=Bacteroides acidifaciens TaxID=85831 RepID=UPI00242FCD11|nr:hypothetical protein [Bacteroides acidifaciens]
MQITVNDRQTLLDIAVIALGSAAGVFALAQRNGLPVTATLADGQTLTYELEDVVSPAVRSAYALRHISPATDIDPGEYKELLYQTGTKRPPLPRPWIDRADDALVVDKLDEVLDLLDRKEPVKVESKQQLTRIFSDPFSEVFS